MIDACQQEYQQKDLKTDQTERKEESIEIRQAGDVPRYSSLARHPSSMTDDVAQTGEDPRRLYDPATHHLHKPPA